MIDEAYFWAALEFRVTAELSVTLHKTLHAGSWCDGIEPTVFNLQQRSPYIQGIAWAGKSGQDDWMFRLYLRKRYSERSQIRWEHHLPDSALTHWLEYDVENRWIIVDPLDSVRDEHRAWLRESHSS